MKKKIKKRPSSSLRNKKRSPKLLKLSRLSLRSKRKPLNNIKKKLLCKKRSLKNKKDVILRPKN
jgi:hypothetical protein